MALALFTPAVLTLLTLKYLKFDKWLCETVYHGHHTRIIEGDVVLVALLVVVASVIISRAILIRA